jgi:hypothetical protein
MAVTAAQPPDEAQGMAAEAAGAESAATDHARNVPVLKTVCQYNTVDELNATCSRDVPVSILLPHYFFMNNLFIDHFFFCFSLLKDAPTL